MKRVLVLSTLCSGVYYKKLTEMRTKAVLDTQQKFLLSIVQGLAECPGVKVDCISVVPLSRSDYPEKVYSGFTEEVDGVTYTYVSFRNFPVVKNFSAAGAMKKAVKDYYQSHKDDEIIVMADALRCEVSEAALYLQKQGLPITAIVTDIPYIAETMGSSGGLRSLYSRWYGRRANNLLLKYDKYILLSEYMNEVVNPSRAKPYMLMECIVNADLFDGVAAPQKPERPAVMYAGKFYRECGVVELAKAAASLRDVCDIWLYGGHGDCTDELEQLAAETDNLLIHGIVPLDEILRLEKACALLINPRFAEEEFSKYSFPSKTAEYMLSGTPVMMYRLPSLPAEYEPYVYLIEEGETLTDSIRRVLSIPEENRNRHGGYASQFIRENKNKHHQASRILEFC